MKISIGTRATVVLATIFAAGCQSRRATRIQENGALFQGLDSFSQQLIQNGLVNYGFTPELVYMALGKPNGITAA